MKSLPRAIFANRVLTTLLVSTMLLLSIFSSTLWPLWNNNYPAQAATTTINGEWTQLFPSPNPGDRRSAAWVYDPIHNVILLFGGIPNGGQTWVYHPDTQTWEQKFPSVSPPARGVHQMAFDTENKVAVIFGGYRTGHGTEIGDTWTYNYETNTWSEITPAVSPPKRHWGGLVYEPVAKKVLLFGGHENIPGINQTTGEQIPDKMYNDVWLLDVAVKTWTKVDPKPGGPVPSPRQVFPIYNPKDGLIYIFGGKYADDHVLVRFFNDVWSYNVSTNTWTVVKPNSTSTDDPSVRRAKWAYDPINNYGIIFSEALAHTDTWIFDFDSKTWTQATIAQSVPISRSALAIIYDPINKRVLLYGGRMDDGITLLGDTWQLTYPNKVPNSTTLTMTLSALSFPWGGQVSVSGKLTDNAASNAGVGGKTITFTGTGASGLPASVVTNPDGTFIATGTAPSTVSTGWTLQAHFAGDISYLASDSVSLAYSTTKHRVALSVSARDIPWGQPTTFTATLRDASAKLVPISGKTIHYDGTGVIGVADQVTNANGVAIGAGTAPSTVASGWTVQAHFAGDSLYRSVDTMVKSYSTTRHATFLSLIVMPSIVLSGAPYKVTGVLSDSITGAVLGSRTISFTADSPIVISDATTAIADGRYTVAGLAAPTSAGSYNIQSHYAGDSLYAAKDSLIRVLKVS